MLGIVSPYLSGRFIDLLIQKVNYQVIVQLCFVLALIGIANIILGYFLNRLSIILSLRASHQINRDIITHLHKVSYSFISKMNFGYMNQRINSDSVTLVNFVINILQNIFVNSLLLLLCMIIVFYYSGFIALTLIFFIIIFEFFYNMLKNSVFSKNLKYKEDQARYSSKILEQLVSIKFIKIFGITSFISKLDMSFDKYYKSALKYQSTYYSLSAAESIVTLCSQIVLYLVGGIKVIKQDMTVGEYSMMTSYFTIMLGSIKYYLGLGKSIQDTKVSCNRINDLLHLSLDNCGKLPIENIDCISLKNCTFAYDSARLISNLTYTFKKGNIYLITGMNGAGKSTLVDIITGLYCKEIEGEIKYNDINIEDLNIVEVLHSKIGIAEQFPTFFNDTLFNNIVIDKTYTDTEVLLKWFNQLNLMDLFLRLQDGFNTTINDNVALSGGERYKIALVRVFIKNPDVIILDEPTASLDLDSTRSLINLLRELKNDKIVIIVSHDTNIMECADFKLVL